MEENVEFDVITLPSQGVFYPKKSLKVTYLTASDENYLLNTQNQTDVDVIDNLLKRKILDKDFEYEDLVEEDKLAILIFLRNTAYGSEYITTLKDPKTNKDFEVKVDLGQLSYKDFKLVADENGLYDYETPIGKNKIKFKFLSNRDIKNIQTFLNDWRSPEPKPVATKSIETMIQSVDGQTDRMFINKFVSNMKIKDSQTFRKFVEENRPGLNLVREETTPSGEIIQFNIGFGVEFFRPFFGG